MQFPSGTIEDLRDLIAQYPLAWLVTSGSGVFDAVPLPLLAETDADGRLVALFGHCSRGNAQVDALRADPRALVLFMGPQGYMSPGLVSQPRWVPTWNFAVAAITVDVEFVEEETLDSVERLTNMAEADKPRPWTLADAGDRIGSLLPRIIAFRAHVREIDARFKLGQEESPAVAADLIAGTADTGLSAWMWRMNADRLTGPAGTVQENSQ